jgi:glycosyltransferase involved in cell wall biosynthesis
VTAPAISVLVPAYRDERTLDAALASIAAQSERDLEIVVSDDGSDDATRAIARGWAECDPRVRLLDDANHVGMTANWNRALAAARGEWIAKLDADDLWEPETLARLRAPFAVEPDLVAAFCRAVECDTALAPLAPWHGEPAFAAAGLDVAVDAVRGGRVFHAMSFDDRQLWHSNAFLVRRGELERLGGWDERWSCASDTDLVLRLLETDRPVAHVAYVGVRYRRRVGSVSDRAAREGWKTLESVLVALAALGRVGAAAVEDSEPLRQNWWRLWRALEAMRGDEELWRRVPEETRAALRRFAEGVPPPPLAIRVAGDLRLGAWKLKRALAGKGT